MEEGEQRQVISRALPGGPDCPSYEIVLAANETRTVGAVDPCEEARQRRARKLAQFHARASCQHAPLSLPADSDPPAGTHPPQPSKRTQSGREILGEAFTRIRRSTPPQRPVDQRPHSAEVLRHRLLLNKGLTPAERVVDRRRQSVRRPASTPPLRKCTKPSTRRRDVVDSVSDSVYYQPGVYLGYIKSRFMFDSSCGQAIWSGCIWVILGLRLGILPARGIFRLSLICLWLGYIL